MKLLKDSLSNGPHLVSPQQAQEVIGTHILQDISSNFASGLLEDPVDCFYRKFALFYFCFFTFYSHIPNVLCHIPNVLSYSKSSIICNWLFVHNKTKINKLIIGTFNFKQELLTTIELLIKLFYIYNIYVILISIYIC